MAILRIYFIPLWVYNEITTEGQKAHGKGVNIMTVKFEHRAYYDSYGTGNYTEDKSKRYSLNFTEEKAEEYANRWVENGCKHYETSEAYFYYIQTDSTHYTQFILYK